MRRPALILSIISTALLLASAGYAAMSDRFVIAAATALSLGLAVASIAVWMRTVARMRREADAQLQAVTNAHQEREEVWRRTVSSLEEEIERRRQHEAATHESRAEIVEAIATISETEPIIAGLAGKAIEKSTEGSTSLTDDIYRIGQRSTELGESITSFLSDMSTGDESLEHNVGELTMDARQLGEIGRLYAETNGSIERSIASISASVHETTELVGQVSDIAERTSVLAINAAIYAAKAGEHGKGFSVIASEIQKLASTAKGVAETIGTKNATIASQVSAFGTQHRDLMTESKASLERTITSLGHTVNELRPAVERISASIRAAAEVSADVTDRLATVNMAMQEQDAIQQIIAHIADILRDVLAQVPADMLAEARDAEDGARVRAHEIAARHFTMKDEYAAVGHDGYDASERGIAVLEDGTELGGDVTLF